MRLCLEDKNNWFVRVIADGEDLLIGSAGMDLNDVSSKTIYGWEWADSADDFAMGLNAKDETFSFISPLSYPTYFLNSLVVQVKHRSGSKKFRAGLISIQR
jgi:hypothetical protein